ncbi:Predicted transmembrane Transcriptional regulator (Anti-sigma factor) [Paraburkholderia ribeironis]|uniref:Predicted transmembrane Transcriptional regulator (Anti-sigma factor) n=1 Tax=Paraburkholderia ribeironis TaxID=1247936 RepID=A0A1N7SFC8_9BURK|nr:zf-HC2 domain-containing protein [Paraburkholderia ribeironis]SIT46093.1 Predicted transmembrane Transcriptional regulator (Anti-sigma factor) [Paraburkholderia ribeironis]
MDCNEARPLLDANADQELSAPQAQRVEQHIGSCDACRRESDSLRVLSGALREAPYHRAPQSLRARIVEGLPAVEGTLVGAASFAAAGTAGTAGAAGTAGTGASPEAAQTPDAAAKTRERQRRRFTWRAWLAGWRGPQGGFGQPVVVGGGASRALAPGWMAALAVALCAAVAVVALNLRRPAEFMPFADELVASHVRAQMSGRDIDVISTDRHTVKPWFNGRLDYSPPVEDLAASGFALQGGRLDYVGHQRVAVLVYRHDKHVIDVYVFPQSRSGGAGMDGAAPAALGHDGYSIAHWDAEGMTWWAVSDAAPDALSGLQAALKARLQSGSERTESG